MSKKFIGTIENKPIHKHRIMIPKYYRDSFSEEADETALVTIGPVNNIIIYPYDNWKKLYKKLSKGNREQRKLLSDMRFFAMTPQKFEGPGRIKLSKELIEIAKINDKVSYVGEGSFISVWNPESLEKIKTERLRRRVGVYEDFDHQIDEDLELSDELP